MTKETENKTFNSYQNTIYEEKTWEHPLTKKARERFNRPLPDYGKATCNDKK